MMPPSESETPASWVYAELVKQPRPHKIIDFPRNKRDSEGKDTGEPIGALAIQVLTSAENLSATADASRKTKRLLGKKETDASEASAGDDDVYRQVLASEILFRVCRDAQDLKKSLFRVPEDVAKYMTPDEISIVFNHYLHFRAVSGPELWDMNDEELEAWVMTIVKGGQFDGFFSVSRPMQMRALIFMASRLRSLQTDSTLSDTPQEPGPNLDETPNL